MKRRADDVVSCCTEFGADSSTYSRFNDAAILTNSWSGKAIFCFDPNCKYMKIVLCFTKLCKACVQLTCIDQHLELLVSWSGKSIFCYDPNCKYTKIVLCFTKLCKVVQSFCSTYMHCTAFGAAS